MKIKKIFIIPLLMMLFISVLSGCNNGSNPDNGSAPDNDEPDFTYYTVTFDSQGGQEIASQEVLAGNTVIRPNSPTRDNFSFIGWYRTSEVIEENLWDFGVDRVNEDMVLYAGWRLLDDIDVTTSLTYQLVNNTYTVTGVGEDTYIIIPETYNNLPVTTIGEGAFTRKDITDIIIPDSITVIGLNAFYNCMVLENIYLSETSNLTTISNNAFSGNTLLKSIYIPAGVESIGDSAFNNCGAIEYFTVASTNAIYSSEGGHLIEKASNTLIRGSINGLVPEGVTTLGLASFRRSEATKIELPSTLTTIQNYALTDCYNLKEITVSATNQTYTSLDGILYNKALTQMIEAPEGLTGEISLPSTLIEIPQFAFDGRTSLTAIYLPAGNLESIDNFAFRNTTLTIRFAGSEEQWNEITKGVVWGGDDLNIIYNYAFNEASNILVVYFTRTNTTERIATTIANELGADLIQIIPEVAYVENYTQLLTVASNELNSNARPAISNETLSQINMDDYQTVFIGYPIWHGSEPMIIRTFIETFAGLENKTVLPFSTAASSDGSTAYNSIKGLCSENADVPSYLHFTNTTISNMQTLVANWLEGLNLNQNNEVEGQRVKMSFNGHEIYLVLVENSATIDLVNRLKTGNMTLSFRDYASAEKIAYPDPELDVSNVTSCDPVVGDVTIYIPWGNIAIFYVDSSGESSSLVKLGSIEGNGIDLLESQTGEFQVILSLE